MIETWVGLGSNLGDPPRQLRAALDAMQEIPETWVLASSALYRSAPMGPIDQPEYVNAVARLRTRLTPLAFLDALQAIERGQGRRREGVERWGPRTLDLDVLLWGAQRLDLPRLTVPHPGLAQRGFVLYPLAELAPDLHIPGQGSLSELLTRTPRGGLTRIEDQRLNNS